MSTIDVRRQFAIGVAVGVVVAVGSLAFAQAQRALIKSRKRRSVRKWNQLVDHADDDSTPIEIKRSGSIARGVAEAVGNTPLIRIASLSDLTGCEILGKAEFLNPAGSSKDRLAVQIIQDAEDRGELVPNTGSWIFEGTVGSTGISLATFARARGYNCCIFLPNDVAKEKLDLLERLGATVVALPPRGIIDPRHYINEARTRANEWKPDAEHPDATAFFADQFETSSNFNTHHNHTGPEILEQTGGVIDAFVSGIGTGGTIAGVAACLKEYDPAIEIIAADPQGSGVYNRIKYGVMYSSTEAEGTRRRHQVDTVVEGIGMNRLAHNLELALPNITDAVKVTDDEAARMSRWLASQDGLFLGSSSAVHCVAAVRTALRLRREGKKRPVVVTILADSGSRHLSKFHNDELMTSRGLSVEPDISDIIGQKNDQN
ncbi:cysteine synthase [Malassezia cuniculi]|uniref:cysteine synthase n=1 Tax=Malassezia cuniculi TaxID=948313 RepID=A0AAF0EXF9_9BASI|nr:cysteine synthase [Malassezia cuniculi]